MTSLQIMNYELHYFFFHSISVCVCVFHSIDVPTKHRSIIQVECSVVLLISVN